MTKDEATRIDATLAEMGSATMRALARAADLAAECASLRAQLAAANAELETLRPKEPLKAVE